MTTPICREGLLDRQMQSLERENTFLKNRLAAAADVIAHRDVELVKYRSIVSQQYKQMNMRSDRF